jgi:hypothetical protein
MEQAAIVATAIQRMAARASAAARQLMGLR